MPREYPLNIEDVHGPADDTLEAVYSKGHHPAGAVYMPDLFLRAAKDHLDRAHDFDNDDLAVLDRAEVRFEWWRCVPAPDGPGAWRIVLHPTGPGRGAFPVTVLDVPPD